LTGFRATRDGMETELGQPTIAIHRDAGKVYYRGVEIREISAWPPEVVARAPVAGTIDLLPLIDPAKDKVAGEWSSTDDGLTCRSGAFVRLALPYEPPAEYDYRIIFTRKTGGLGVVQTLSKDGRAFLWSMSAGTKWHGFELIDGKDVFTNGTGVAGALANNRRHESIVQVRADGLKAYLNGMLIVERKTNYQELSEQPKWALGNEKLLGLGSSSNEVVFHTIEVKEISGPGTFARPDDPAAKKARNTSGIAAPPPTP
jgi:hypothetical protein